MTTETPNTQADSPENTSKNATGKTAAAVEEGLPDVGNSQKRNPWVLAFMAAALGMLGFFYYIHQHPKETTDSNASESFSIDSAGNNPPPLTAEQKAKIKAIIQNAPPAPSTEQQQAMLDRIRAPIMVVNSGSANTNKTTATQTSDTHNLDPNTQFLNQVGSEGVETAEASVLQHRDLLLAQGNLIEANLESAINSDLPGMIRAIVAKPVYSEDGSRVLITPGSRLIGQYKSGMMTGQGRVFVVWTRLIEPNGISLMLGSPGVDSLGEAGMAADGIDRHFWQMFGTATLLSMIGAGASNVGVNTNDPYNASQAYRQAMAQSFANSANNSLQQNMMIPPTLVVHQGDPIVVFVAKDLDFSKAMKKANTTINVF